MIATIINFCSNEYRFLHSCITEARKFSKTIHIAVCDHFFDGTPEDLPLLENIFRQYSDVNFFLYPFLPGILSSIHLWHNVSRLISFSFLPKEIEYVLFLDADEIVEGDSFQEWQHFYPYDDFDFLKLYCYWYFRETRYQAKNWETSPLLANKSSVNRKLIMQKGERCGMFREGKGRKIEGILGKEEKPLIHHYSWVRTKEEMLKKVRSWGHAKDCNWTDLVEKEFAGPFQGKDFVHGYEFQEVKPFIELNFSLPKTLSYSLRHVKRLSSRQLLSLIFGLPLGLIKNIFYRKTVKQS